MAIFANSAATQVTAVTSSSALIFNVAASGIPTGAVLGDVIVQNTGTVTFFIGSFTGVTATTGLRVPAGAQVTYNGFGAVQSSTNGNIYAITASGTSSALTGLATVNANV